ncbi:MAG: leucyl aminopeptidase [Anaerolineae bacterium]|nr:leucyl aminopeptidase [Candidatus Roseilinea sp.]MDW8448409.1 leucyl aminopeptidase [Anaerolineae bacterium]
MADLTSYLAWRIVQGVGAQPGELILLLDHAGRDDLLREVAFTIELAGATPLVELAPPEHVARLLASGQREHFAQYDRHRRTWLQHADRSIVLTSGYLDLDGAPPDAVALWSAAQDRLTQIEEARRMPSLIVAVPTSVQAQRLGMSLGALEHLLHEAAAPTLLELQDGIVRAQSRLENAQEIVIRTGGRCELRLVRGNRPILNDDGYIDDLDRERGAVVSTLPAGSIYFTVLEDQTEGSLYLPTAGDVRDVIFHFECGRAMHIEASTGAAELNAFFDAHTGEPRRIGHIKVGLNPRLRRPIGWPLVDEHVRGAVVVAFGENRAIGGQNASSLNEDFIAPDAEIEADGQRIVL